MKYFTICLLLLTISCSLLVKNDPDEVNGFKVILEDRPMERATALAIYPFVFVHKDHQDNQTLINHENIHLEQYKELLWIGFPIVYTVQYLRWLIFGTSWWPEQEQALEQEAYENQHDLDYLKKRKPYAWVNY